jgi:CheY-like chemotaxis protein
MARVLLVEDEISLLLLAESVVQGLGHSTFSASNRGQALALLDDPDEIDLLFTAAPELARAVKHLLSQREDARRNTPRKGAPVRSSRGHFQGSRSRRTSVAEVAASRDE